MRKKVYRAPIYERTNLLEVELDAAVAGHPLRPVRYVEHVDLETGAGTRYTLGWYVGLSTVPTAWWDVLLDQKAGIPIRIRQIKNPDPT